VEFKLYSAHQAARRTLRAAAAAAAAVASYKRAPADVTSVYTAAAARAWMERRRSQ